MPDTTEKQAPARQQRPKATGLTGDAQATRIVRLEMAVDDLGSDVRAMTRAINARAAFWSMLVSKALEPATLRWLVFLCLGLGVLLGGGSLAFGEYFSIGQETVKEAE